MLFPLFVIDSHDISKLELSMPNCLISLLGAGLDRSSAALLEATAAPLQELDITVSGW